jgi:hypothetical protein
MTYYISYLKDVLGNNYLGIKFDSGFVSNYLEKLKGFLSEKDYEIYTSNQIKRDGGNFHLTLINVIDYNRLSTSMGMDKLINSLERVFSEPIDDLKFKGIGKATKGDNTSYYIVCSSKKLDIIRQIYSLSEFDFHITLGFKWKDDRRNRELHQDLRRTNVKLQQELRFPCSKKIRYVERSISSPTSH